jgi:hypothetical protein
MSEGPGRTRFPDITLRPPSHHERTGRSVFGLATNNQSRFNIFNFILLPSNSGSQLSLLPAARVIVIIMTLGK